MVQNGGRNGEQEETLARSLVTMCENNNVKRKRMYGMNKKEGEASRAFCCCFFFFFLLLPSLLSCLVCLFVGVLASRKWLGCELPTWKTLNPRYGWHHSKHDMICHALLSLLFLFFSLFCRNKRPTCQRQSTRGI